MKPRNQVVHGMIASPKRNAGRHADKNDNDPLEEQEFAFDDTLRCELCNTPLNIAEVAAGQDICDVCQEET